MAIEKVEINVKGDPTLVCVQMSPSTQKEGRRISVHKRDQFVFAQALLLTTTSPPFFLRDSRLSEMLVRLKITTREKRRHAAGGEKIFSAFRSFYYPWGKMGYYL